MGKEKVKALFEAYASGEGFAEVYLLVTNLLSEQAKRSATIND